MDTFLRHICFWVFLTAFGVSMTAQDSLSVDSVAAETEMPKLDSISISILTCTPGADLYAKFGHTALRVQDFTLKKDVVFNYGCFNYDSDNFVWKFLLGQTDYLLAAEPFDFFIYRYEEMGNGVTEQVLNLSQEEANRLLRMLLENLRPENQEYRYRWLGVNCTNMVQFQIERLADEEEGDVIYNWGKEGIYSTTVRDFLHEKLHQSPWICFGIDMILGHEIDDWTLMAVNPDSKQRTKLFMPSYFQEVVGRSTIQDADSTQRKYVVMERVLIPATYTEEAPSFFTPMVTFILLLLLVGGISVYDWRRGEVSLWLDVTLATLQGLAGILVAFLYFYSEHPGVDSNWLVIIFNPIPLCYAAWMVVCQRRGCRNRLAIVNVAVLAAFLLTMWLCPQVFHPAMYVVVLILLTRATIYYLIEKKKTS